MMRTAKRREQSRSAAKCRRLTESEVYVELADVLPNVDQQTVYQADRIGLLRLASMVCRTRRLMSRLFPSTTDKAKNRVNMTEEPYLDEVSVARCLDGFVLIVNKAGQLLYVSAGASASIGFTQIDLAGKYFRDYVHNDDWNSLCQQLRVTGSEKPLSTVDASQPLTDSKIFFRMKTAMTPRGGRARKLTMAVYQPMQACIVDPSDKMKGPSFDAKNTLADEDIRILYCIPFTLSPLQKSFTSVASSSVACTRHEVDMRFRFCSDKLASSLQYGNAKKLVGQSFYDLVYPDDLASVARQFRQMYKNGHVTTSYYRLSTSTGGYIWTMTEAALLVQNIRGVTQKSIICNHFILSGGEPCWPGGDQLRKPREIAAPRDLTMETERTPSSSIVQTKTPPISVAQILLQQRLDALKNEEKAESLIPTTSMPFMDPFKNARPFIGLPDDRPDLCPYIGPHMMDKYGLFCMPGAAAKPFEFNSILMAAMGATFPFAPPSTQPAKLFTAAKPYPFPPMPMFSFDRPDLPSPIITTPSDLNHVALTHAALSTVTSPWTPSFPSRFQPYPPPSVILPKGIKTDVIVRPDEIGRRHRLDAKTIESFEVAMIKNELTVGNE